jgi:hypothetical protein
MNEQQAQPLADRGIDPLRRQLDESSIGTPGPQELRDRARREDTSRATPLAGLERGGGDPVPGAEHSDVPRARGKPHGLK